jgi:hypothetical protein
LVAGDMLVRRLRCRYANVDSQDGIVVFDGARELIGREAWGLVWVPDFILRAMCVVRLLKCAGVFGDHASYDGNNVFKAHLLFLP